MVTNDLPGIVPVPIGVPSEDETLADFPGIDPLPEIDDMSAVVTTDIPVMGYRPVMGVTTNVLPEELPEITPREDIEPLTQVEE